MDGGVQSGSEEVQDEGAVVCVCGSVCVGLCEAERGRWGQEKEKEKERERDFMSFFCKKKLSFCNVKFGGGGGGNLIGLLNCSTKDCFYLYYLDCCSSGRCSASEG